MEEKVDNNNEIIENTQIKEEKNDNEVKNVIDENNINDIKDIKNTNHIKDANDIIYSETVKDENNVKDKKDNYISLETEEDEINKEDINNIVDYLSNLDYEKYTRDMEIKEALMILRTKMEKDQEQQAKEEEKQNEKIKIVEDNNQTIFNTKNNEQNLNLNEENTININKNQNSEYNINNNNNEKNNEIKEPKEIINEEEVKKKEKIEKYREAEKIAKHTKLKDVHSVQSVQKLLLRENIDQTPLKITIIKENPLAGRDEYIPNKLPFLHSIPLV